MPVFKNESNGTWYVMARYVNWKGERKQKCKRGFATKKEAQEWERMFQLQNSSDMDMSFEAFTELYIRDMKSRLKENTWLTKEHIIRTKILPYFGKLKISEISTKEVIAWQNEMLAYRDEKKKPYSQTYLKTLHNQLSAIFNHAVRYYELRSNPAAKAGNMGSEEHKEMLFWTKEEYKKFSFEMMDKPVSFYAFEMLYWCGIREGELLALIAADFDFEKESALDIDDHDSDEDDGDFADLDSFEDEEELDSSDDYLDLEFDEKPAPEPKKETSKSAPTPDIDEVLEIEEPSEDEITERMGKFDTGFVVQGRYDLSATSEIGLKLGLTEEQKQLFSYFVPIRGVSEQLVEILDNDKRCRNRYGTSRTGNILILGRKGSGKTVLAVDIVKAIQKQRRLKQGKVAIVTGDSLNKKDIGSIIDKLNGGALIIEKASKMNDRTIRELNDMMDEQTGELLFLLEDQKKPLERMFASHREFKRKFTSRLELPVFINDELVTFGQTYAKENGYRIDEMGILALYSRIDMMQREDHAVTVAEVKEIMDLLPRHSTPRSSKRKKSPRSKTP